MPFRSAKQRAFLWANHPDIARRWTKEHGSKIVPSKKKKKKKKTEGKVVVETQNVADILEYLREEYGCETPISGFSEDETEPATQSDKDKVSAIVNDKSLPEVAEDGKVYVVKWADGRGIFACKKKSYLSSWLDDTGAWAEIISIKYEDPDDLEIINEKLSNDPNTGLPLNRDGTVTVYHHTSAANAAKIKATGILKSAGEPHVYVTTHKQPDTGYGEAVVQLLVNPRFLMIDDEFPDGRQDFRISVGKPGGSIRVKVGDISQPKSTETKSINEMPYWNDTNKNLHRSLNANLSVLDQQIKKYNPDVQEVDEFTLNNKKLRVTVLKNNKHLWVNVYTNDLDRNVVAEFVYDKKDFGWAANSAAVSEEYQSQGIASKIYIYVIEVYFKTLFSDVSLTGETGTGSFNVWVSLGKYFPYKYIYNEHYHKFTKVDGFTRDMMDGLTNTRLVVSEIELNIDNLNESLKSTLLNIFFKE